MMSPKDTLKQVLRHSQDPVDITRSVLMQAQELGFELFWDPNDKRPYNADQHIEIAKILMGAEQLKETQHIKNALGSIRAVLEVK